MNETHQLPCLKRKLVHSDLLCIWSVDKKQIRQTQCMELFIVTYQCGLLLPRNVICNTPILGRHGTLENFCVSRKKK